MVDDVRIVNTVDTTSHITGDDICLEEHNKMLYKYHLCEYNKKQKSWIGAALLTIAGVAIVLAYKAKFEEFEGKSESTDEILLQCTQNEHDHWRDSIYTRIVAINDYVKSIPEIEVEGQDAVTCATSIASTIADITEDACDINTSQFCGNCCDSCEIDGYAALASVNSANSYKEYTKRRKEKRRAMKYKYWATSIRGHKQMTKAGQQALMAASNIYSELSSTARTQMAGGYQVLGAGLGRLGHYFANKNHNSTMASAYAGVAS